MKLIFICKHNVFRSRVAEEYFKKINGNPRIKVTSGGLIMGGNSDMMQRGVSRSLLGVDIATKGPKPLILPEMRKADMITVVADDVPKIIFNYQKKLEPKIVIWKIKDEQIMRRKNVIRAVSLIKKKVESLVKDLENRK